MGSLQGNYHNLIEMIDQAAGRRPRSTALIFGAKRITYCQMQSISRQLASKLYDLGVRRQDKVALWLPNCPEFVFSFFAVLRIGAIVVPVNTMFKREEAKFIIDDAGVKVLFCSVGKIADSENILSRVESLKHIISHPVPAGHMGVHGFYRFIAGAPEFISKEEVSADALAEIIYTSGTTGRPKGACLTHNNLLSNVTDSAQVIKFSRRDCVICILPLFHSFASTVCMLLPLSCGGRIVIMGAVRPFKRVIRAIFRQRVTIFAGVPSLYNILAEANFPRYGLILSWFINPVRVCICGAAALPFKVWQNFEKKFKRPLLQGYGLTEASPVVSLNPLRGKKPASIGRPLPSVRVKVVDPAGRELPVGEVGELLVKGPNVMRGYYNLEEDSQNTLRGGWLYTGDLAKIDAEGFIYIMGRLKEMINVRGLNVYPREIEDVLYRCPKVREAAVVGVFHRHRGEVPVAFVVEEAAAASEREIINYLRRNLASYKVPLRVIFKESLPKNSTGKILKKELQREVQDIFQ